MIVGFVCPCQVLYTEINTCATSTFVTEEKK